MGIKDRVEAMQKSKYSWVFSIIEYLLVFAFGVLVCWQLRIENIQNECDQFVVDNYFTYEMQICYIEQTGNSMGVPFGNMSDYDFSIGYDGIK